MAKVQKELHTDIYSKEEISEDALPVYEQQIFDDGARPFKFHFGHTGVIPHWHENMEILCFHGKGRVICGREIYDVDKGDIAVFNSNMLHSVKSYGSSYNCLVVDVSFLKKCDVDIMSLQFDSVIRSEAVLELFLLVEKEVKKLEKGEPFGTAAVKSAILVLVVELCREFSRKGEYTGERGDIVKRAIGYIKAHFGEVLTVSRIAENVNVSKYHFCREFHRETGFTVVQYINNLRCREAEKLISKGKCSITEAARVCGFKNLSYFTRTYKEIIGQSPSKSKPTPKDVQ